MERSQQIAYSVEGKHPLTSVDCLRMAIHAWVVFMSRILKTGRFSLGLQGLTLFVETPWFDASIGR